MSKVLVTGFGPYGVTPVNPAQLTAEELDGRTIAGATVISRIVPNTFFESIAAAQQAIAEIEPALVIMLGEYPGRSMITVERLAQNVNDCGRYGLADCAGRVLVGEPTDPAGPVAYHATVPVRAMVLAMRKAGVPADVSDAAGTFVCNHLMYGVLHHSRPEGSARPRRLDSSAVPAQRRRTGSQPRCSEHVGPDGGRRGHGWHRGSHSAVRRYPRTDPVAIADLGRS